MQQSSRRKGVSPLNIALSLVVIVLVGVVSYQALVVPASQNKTVTSTATTTATTTARFSTTTTETGTSTTVQTVTTSTTATVTSLSTSSASVTVTSTSYTVETSTLTQTMGTTTTITTFAGGSIPPATPPYSATAIVCSPSMKNCTLTLVNPSSNDVAILTGAGCALISTAGLATQSGQCISSNGGVVPARGSAPITITFAPNAFPGVGAGQEFAGWIALTSGIQVPLLGTFGQ